MRFKKQAFLSHVYLNPFQSGAPLNPVPNQPMPGRAGCAIRIHTEVRLVQFPKAMKGAQRRNEEPITIAAKNSASRNGQ